MTNLISSLEACQLGDKPEPPYFVGVYDKPAPLPDPFESAGWMSHCLGYAEQIGLGGKAKTSASFKLLVKKALYGDVNIGRHLPAAVGVLRRVLAKRGKIKVLDLGGGFGDNYHLLGRAAIFGRSRLPLSAIEYHVVDNERSCALGRNLYAHKAHAPKFFVSIPDEKYDVVLVIGTLQYIPDVGGLFAKLKDLCDDSIYVARSPIRVAGGTFMTRQVVCPTSGDFAFRKIGETYITVVSKLQLLSVMEGWPMTVDEFHTDYSSNFARLPEEYRNVAYLGMCWTRPGP